MKPSPSRPASPRAARRAAGTACSTRSRIVARFGEKRLARLGQLDPARLAPEQLHVELGFERADLLAERRLLDAEPLGRAGDVTLLGDGDEIAEVAQFHSHTYNVSNSSRYHILDTARQLLGIAVAGLSHGERSETSDRAIPEMGRRAAAQLCRVARGVEQHLPAELRLGRRDRRRSRRARRRRRSGADGARPGEAGRSRIAARLRHFAALIGRDGRSIVPPDFDRCRAAAGARPLKENARERHRSRQPEDPPHPQRRRQELRLFQPRRGGQGGRARRHLAPAVLAEGAAGKSGAAGKRPHRHGRRHQGDRRLARTTRAPTARSRSARRAC